LNSARTRKGESIMKTYADLQRENSLQAVANIKGRGLREGSGEWLTAYETELSTLTEAAARREGITFPRAATPGAETAARLARRGLHQKEFAKVTAEWSKPPAPPVAASPTTAQLRARLAQLEAQKAPVRPAASAPAAPSRSTTTAPSPKGAAVVPISRAQRPQEAGGSVSELLAAVRTLADFSGRARDGKAYQAAYHVFINHQPMHLKGGQRLVSAIADAANKRGSAENVRAAAMAVVQGLDEGPRAA
jgi:hypothetical protein